MATLKTLPLYQKMVDQYRGSDRESMKKRGHALTMINQIKREHYGKVT